MIEILISVKNEARGVVTSVSGRRNGVATPQEHGVASRIRDELEIVLGKISGTNLVTGEVKVGLTLRQMQDGKIIITTERSGKADETVERMAGHIEKVLDNKMREVAKRPGFVAGKIIQ